LDCLGKKYVEKNNNIIVEEQTIICGNEVFYMDVDTRNVVANQLFSLVNNRLAEIEKQIAFRKEEENKRLLSKAQQEDSLYEARKLKKLNEEHQRELLRLELEQKSYVEAKKQEIIRIAKEKGYSIQEKFENGKIQLKLIKRIY
jgi:hypothetical protein